MPNCPSCSGTLSNPQGNKWWCSAELKEVELAEPGSFAWCFQQGAAMEKEYEKEHGHPLPGMLVNNSRHTPSPEQMKEIIKKGKAAGDCGPRALTPDENQDFLTGHLKAAAGNLKLFNEEATGLKIKPEFQVIVAEMAEQCQTFLKSLPGPGMEAPVVNPCGEDCGWPEEVCAADLKVVDGQHKGSVEDDTQPALKVASALEAAALLHRYGETKCGCDDSEKHIIRMGRRLAEICDMHELFAIRETLVGPKDEEDERNITSLKQSLDEDLGMKLPEIVIDNE
jgi:hypothetical protein